MSHLSISEGLDLIERDIDRQGEVVGNLVPQLRCGAADAISAPAAPAHIYLVGSGDSFDASHAAALTWQGLVDVPVHAFPSMTFTSSVVTDAPAGSWVVVLSQSGQVSRAVEAIRTARRRDLRTIAITANPTSALAKEPADHTWVIDFPKLGAVPGMTSHVTGSAALLELGAALAAPSKGDKLRAELDSLADLVSRTVSDSWGQARAHAKAFSRETPVLTLGYAGGLSAARFAARKIMELSQLITISQETEEYAHDEYSLIDARFRILQFAPTDRGHHRNQEVSHYLRRLGVHLAVVTDAAAPKDVAADIVYTIPRAPQALLPLLMAVPGQVLSLEIARLLGGSLYGNDDRVHAEDGDPQIYESEVMTP